MLLYRDLAKHLGPDQPVYGLQAQGLDGKRAFLRDFKDIAAHYVSEVKAFEPKGPYYLGGYCSGGTLAYEMAQQLRSQGIKVELVVMLETYNIQQRKRVSSMVRKSYHLLQNMTYHVANFYSLVPHKKRIFLQEKVKVSMDRMRGRIHLGLSRITRLDRSKNHANGLYIRLSQVNDQAHSEYLPRPYNGGVALFRPRGFFRGMDDPNFAWKELVGEGLKVYELPVWPRAMLVEPFVRTLAERLRKCIEDTMDKEPVGSNFGCPSSPGGLTHRGPIGGCS